MLGLTNGMLGKPARITKAQYSCGNRSMTVKRPWRRKNKAIRMHNATSERLPQKKKANERFGPSP
jgi:hypothetical protein